MPTVGTMWIRDGVLVNRMHVNPVAFAYSYYAFTAPEKRANITVEQLINFGFAKSGISCAEKMRLFNVECVNALEHVEAAASFYNILATEAANSCTYFDGAIELLADLQAAGAKNFITSAVDQPVLDAWKTSTQGSLCAPYLAEILGKRPNFLKGRDHFEHASKLVNAQPIYCVADASAEIASAKESSAQYNLIPVGFGYVVDQHQVLEAVALVQNALVSCGDQAPYVVEATAIDPKLLVLQDAGQVESSLRAAGAEFVATGGIKEIMNDLRGYFRTAMVLADRTAV